MQWFRPYCIILLGQFLGLTAGAAPVTFFFTGQVNSEAINGCGALVNCGVVFGSYTFDSAAPDQNPNPTTGLYAATNIAFSIDGASFFSSPTGVINVANFTQVDQYGVLATGTASNASTATLSILLADPTATAFSSDALPQNSAALTKLLPGTFQLNAADDTFQLLGSIDSVISLPAGSGLVRVCKVGAGGIAPGTNFTFSVGGTPVTVAAGSCSALITEVAGSLAVNETVPAADFVASVTTNPAAALVSADQTTGNAVITVTAAALTTVTFTDVTLADTGLVQICKNPGAGVILGTPFAFSVAGTPQSVIAGACGSPVREAMGNITVSETLPANFALASVSASPVGSLVGMNLASATATVTVTAGGLTVVTFTNALAAGANVEPGPFLVRYAARLDAGDAFVDMTNSGDSLAVTPSGNICVNAYAFDPAEELVSCCACLVTPNGLDSLSVKQSLLGSTLTPALPSAVVIKLIASEPGSGGGCNAATPSSSNLVQGLHAWGTSLHPLPGGTAYGATETPFAAAALSLAEFAHITSTCQFIQSNGSGFGICKGCQAGGN